MTDNGLQPYAGCFSQLALRLLLAVCVGLVRLPVSFSSFLFFVRGQSLNHFLGS